MGNFLLRVVSGILPATFLIIFIGVNFEAGNETRDFVAEQKEEWSEKRVVFCSYRCFLESEKLRCENWKKV